MMDYVQMGSIFHIIWKKAIPQNFMEKQPMIPKYK